MKRLYSVLHTVLLVLVTLAAASVMWWLGQRGNHQAEMQQVVAPLGEFVEPRPPVAVVRIEPEDCSVYAVYTGTIRPWETYSIAYEIAGRVATLGTNADGTPLDEGDRVEKGDVLARLDDEILASRVEETSAMEELAQSERRRAEGLRKENAISEAEYLLRLTEATQARAKHKIAEQNLNDATLVAPVTGTISKREINVGESVAPHQMAFEIVADDRVILAVEVPESRIHDLQTRWRAIESQDPGDPRDAFKAIVFMEGRDRFGMQRDAIEGRVHHLANVANTTTGTFEVEIELANEDFLLRSGMVATAWIETDRLHAYRLPESAVVFRNNRGHVFTLDEELIDVEALYWPVGQAVAYRARLRELDRFIEQRPLPGPQGPIDIAAPSSVSRVTEAHDLLVPADGDEPLEIVVRGQHRLSSGQLVRVMNPDDLAAPPEQRSRAVRAPSVVVPPNRS